MQRSRVQIFSCDVECIGGRFDCHPSQPTYFWVPVQPTANRLPRPTRSGVSLVGDQLLILRIRPWFEWDRKGSGWVSADGRGT